MHVHTMCMRRRRRLCVDVRKVEAGVRIKSPIPDVLFFLETPLISLGSAKHEPLCLDTVLSKRARVVTYAPCLAASVRMNRTL